MTHVAWDVSEKETDGARYDDILVTTDVAIHPNKL